LRRFKKWFERFLRSAKNALDKQRYINLSNLSRFGNSTVTW